MKKISVVFTGLIFLFISQGYSQVTKINSHTFKHATGLVHSLRHMRFLRQAPRDSLLQARTPIPRRRSLRGRAGPVEDQGNCGSCWDFSLTSALRGTWILAGKDPGRLSFNYLLNCTGAEGNCDGGDFSAAELFLNPKGAPRYGSDGEYTATQTACVSASPIATTVTYRLLGSNTDENGLAPLPSFKDIAYAVGVLHRPVTVDLFADDAYENYHGGIFNTCSAVEPANTNHMVVIEGYDCETSVDARGHCVFDAKGNLPAGVGLWIFRNSWGTDWGDHGYMTTKATDAAGRLCNGIATDALYYKIR